MKWSLAPHWPGRLRRRGPLQGLAAGALLLGLVAGMAPLAPAASAADDDSPDADPPWRTVYALTGASQIVGFDPLRPERVRFRVAVTNLKSGERLVGIDFRPLTGRLYGVGSTSQVYTINLRNGFAAPIGAPFTPGLDGAENGVDFNPQADRLRVVSKAGQNLRLNPDTGAALADGPLAYAAQPPADANAGQQPGVTGAAYTNNFAGTTATTLYDVDATQDVLALQNPPNDGTLRTVGSLQQDAGDLLGFDIVSLAGGNRLAEQLSRCLAGGAPDAGLAVSQPAGSQQLRLYSVDLGSGRVRDRGSFPDGVAARGLAIALDAPERPDND